jgi:hypothetical protein
MKYFKQHKHLVFLILFLLFCFNTHASSTKHAVSVWGDAQVSSPISNSEQWKYRLELQIHSPPINNTDDTYDDTVGFGIGRVLNDRQEIWLGYDAVSTFDSDDEANLEQRLWQELSWRIFANGKHTWRSRTRLEERKDEHSSVIALRLRQRLTVYFKQRLFWQATPVVYDEIFLNLNQPDWITNKLVDQNRLFLGVKIPIGKNKSLQVGYLNQFKFRDSQDYMNHILSISFGIDIDPVLPRAVDLSES